MAESRQFFSFDILDYKIIQELHQNARADASKIARAVGANERTVRKRIDRLVTSDAVRLAAIVNPRAFGYITMVNIFLEVQPEHEENVVEHFLTMPEIAHLAYGLGERDMLIIQAYFKDNEAMREFLRRTLPAIPNVKITGYTLVPRVLRSIDEWMPKSEDFRMKLSDEHEIKD